MVADILQVAGISRLITMGLRRPDTGLLRCTRSGYAFRRSNVFNDYVRDLVAKGEINMENLVLSHDVGGTKAYQLLRPCL